MTNQRKFEILGFLFISAIAICFVRGWQLERAARSSAETTTAQTHSLIVEQAKQIADRDALNAQYSQTLATAAKAIRTPAQAAQVIIHYLPAPVPVPGQPAPAPAAIPIVTAAQLPADVVKDLPVAPNYGILTGTQLEDIARNDLTCDAAQHSLTTCAADKASLAAELAATQKQSDTWEAAAKGGTKFHRFLGVAKFVGCAGLGAGAGAIADKKSPTIGSAVGAAAGVTVCSIL